MRVRAIRAGRERALTTTSSRALILLGLSVVLLVPAWARPASSEPATTGSAAMRPARAQSAVTDADRARSKVAFTHMRLSIWPEYDDPRVLVIMEPVLDDSVRLPTKVSFLVPRGASVSMACEVAPGGAHSCRPKEITRRGAWDEIGYMVLTERRLFLEYHYDPDLGSPNRRLDFNYLSTAVIGRLDVEVQQPVGATGFTMTPRPQATVKTPGGFVYHQYGFGEVRPGKAVSVAIGYAKADREAAAPATAAGRAVGEPRAAEQPRATSGTGRGLDVAVGLFGLAGLIGAVAYLLLLGATTAPEAPDKTPEGKRVSGPGAHAGSAPGAGAEASGRAAAEAGSKAGNGAGNEVGAGDGEGAREGAGERVGDGAGEGAVLCSNCGAGLGLADTECPRCGMSQELVCVRCGARCGRDNEFCPECGAELAILARQRNITLVDANDLAERMRAHGEGGEEAGREEG